ncbi:MAG: hypothetical protein WC399_04595 [Bacilli bacterium]|jgi:hypothetical protein
MKKKLILLPLLMLVLGACGSSVEPSSSNSEPTSTEPVEDTNVYRLVGSFSDPQWVVDSADYVMEKATGENVFTFEALDLFVDEQWQITVNGSWDNQIGFTSTITLVDPDTTMGQGDGPTVKNFKVLTDGNYDIELDTGVTPRKVTITRNGDPVDVPTEEENADQWYLAGSMTDPAWAAEGVLDDDFELIEDDTIANYYFGTFDLEANDEFKVVPVDLDDDWTYARGASKVQADDPVPSWLDLTSAGGNIKILEAGQYKVEFYWVASVGANLNGSIFITQIPNLPQNMPATNLLSAKVLDDAVTLTEAYIIAVVTGDSSLFVGTPEGTTMINYYSATDLVAQFNALTVGQYITVSGLVKSSTGGTGANAKTVVPSTLTVVTTPSWIAGEVESVTTPISMADATLKTFIDTLDTNKLGVVYTFTDVKFKSTTLSGPTLTGYDYFMPDTVSVGINNLGISETVFMQVGFFKYDLDEALYNTTDTYTVTVSVLGCNKTLPLAIANGSGKIRLAGYVEITLQTPAV